MMTHSQTANGKGQGEIEEEFDEEFCDVCICSAHLESNIAGNSQAALRQPCLDINAGTSS